jgi:HPr kinase/phosphorylase
MSDKQRLEANCVCVMGVGVLILGPSASGKSDLTLRLLSARSALLEEPCRLVSDDQTCVWSENGALFASPPPQIAGRLEVRGVGVLRFDHLEKVKISLAVELVERDEIERIPELGAQMSLFGDIQIPKVNLIPFEASAPEKMFSLIMALHHDGLANDI